MGNPESVIRTSEVTRHGWYPFSVTLRSIRTLGYITTLEIGLHRYEASTELPFAERNYCFTDGFMTEKELFEAFRAAVLEEQNAQGLMDQLYSDFIVKMLNYQTGKGPIPTEKEFEAWRLAVDCRIDLAKKRGLL